jgi:hypothetical protein
MELLAVRRVLIFGSQVMVKVVLIFGLEDGVRAFDAELNCNCKSSDQQPILNFFYFWLYS